VGSTSVTVTGNAFGAFRLDDSTKGFVASGNYCWQSACQMLEPKDPGPGYDEADNSPGVYPTFGTTITGRDPDSGTAPPRIVKWDNKAMLYDVRPYGP
jgi:hypothetical protein